LETKFTAENIVIDGKMDETAWQSVAIAKDFVIYEPQNGTAVPENRRTEVKVLYDNNAIYIYAKMYDEDPSKIMKEMSKRDDFGSADNFGVFINGNNDGQQDFEFIVSASDSQADALATTNNEDWSWDAVWDSKAVFTAYGWAAEIKIPYAAVRFPLTKVQTWGINFWREIKRDRQIHTWCFVDKTTNNFGLQEGILNGIENIKTPTRLFFLPYVSQYFNGDVTQKTFGTLKGGMDIKYGINDAFTLDAILIPDFGQTALDQQILNLGPFEQQFNENRSFFTEGTDLFNKGGLFYSRRIGGSPTVELELGNDEKIIKSPSSVSLINALKISGRTKAGLGIGILNAVTENTLATIQNTITGETRREIVEPLTNYNLLVLDQRFRKNSSVSFINLMTLRNGTYKDANVSALVFDLKSKANAFQLLGDFKFSYVDEISSVKRGVKTGIEFNKISGEWRAGVGGDLFTKDFDPNDLGINFQTNYFDFYANASYQILKPIQHFNSLKAWIGYYSEVENTTGKFRAGFLNLNLNGTTKKNHYVGTGFNINPIQTYDFYEPRTEGRFLLFPKKIGVWAFISTDYSRKFAIDFNPSFAKLFEDGRNSYGIDFGPRYRFNDKFSMVYRFNFFRQNNNKGYVDNVDTDLNPITPNDIIFANRTVVTYSNSLSGKYSLNSRMNFNLSIRQYWSYAENHNFFSLQNDGTLLDYANYTTNKNSSFSNWNLDLAYTWWFAAGSQMSVLYRNNASNFERSINKDLGQNITNLLNNDALAHSFSISIKYFIDYNQAKHWF
jgi:Domain of unknown function (DUF5916)/Carbohydrate family 9 binding domain-like